MIDDYRGADELTGLLGRGLFLDRVDAALLKESDLSDEPALLVLDVDRFKKVNDSAGHDTGDKVLQRVATRILRAVEPEAVVARISGDEFAIFLPSGRDAKATASRLLDLIGRPYAVNGHAIKVTTSIGVAQSPGDGNNADALMQSANIALHRAENEGRNRQCTFEVSMLDSARLRAALESDLRAAIALQQMELRNAMALDQFLLEYQPRIDLASEQVVGFESLLRWRHPVRGLVEPDSFIPLAEEIGLICIIGDWVLRTACRAAAKWPTPRSGSPLSLSVNVSALQLREGPIFATAVGNALAESGLAPERLVLEITESMICDDSLPVLLKIGEMGVHLALDDFGTGFSSLSQLSHLPVSQIKIDRSFVRHVASLPAGQLSNKEVRPSTVSRAVWMLRAIAGLGSGLGITTVAEGVETLAQANVLRFAGVNEIQGYLVSRPVAEAEVPEAIQALTHGVLSRGASA